MQMAIHQIIDLIEHFRQENLKEQNRCFYCGGFHRTVDCQSPKREAFYLSLQAVAEIPTEEEVVLGQNELVSDSYKEDYSSSFCDLWRELA